MDSFVSTSILLVPNVLFSDINNLLLILLGIVLIFWAVLIIRAACNQFTLAVGVHNDTTIQLHDYTPTEVEMGLIPSTGFNQFLRTRDTQLHPPNKIENYQNQVFIHKSSFRIVHNGDFSKTTCNEHVNSNNDDNHSDDEVDDSTRLLEIKKEEEEEISEEEEKVETPCTVEKIGVAFDLDCSVPVTIRVYWDINSDEINRLLDHSLLDDDNDSESDNSANDNNIKHSSSSDSLIDESQEARSSPSMYFDIQHCKIKSREYSLNEGLGQKFTLPEEDWILLEEFLSCINNNSSSNNIAVIIRPQVKNDTESVALIGLPRFSAFFSETESKLLTGINVSLEQQILHRNGNFFALKDVFGMDDHAECVICLTELRDVTLLPCNHFCVCHECFQMIENCPICRAKITAFIRFYEKSPDNNNTEANCAYVEVNVE